jgi:hypothetical protein
VVVAEMAEPVAADARGHGAAEFGLGFGVGWSGLRGAVCFEAHGNQF